MQGFSLVAASGGHSSSWCAGLSLSWPLLLQSTGSRRAGSVVVAHGPSCSAACGIFPDQGSNPCPLHWQADSQPLRHQGSPITLLKLEVVTCSVSYINTLLKPLPYRWFGLILTHTALGTKHTSVPGVGAKGLVLFLVAEPCCLWFLYRRGWITVLRMYLMEAWWVPWLPSYR